MRAAGTGRPTPALEAVVEASILLSALAFENTGLSIAHSVTRGLVVARGVAAVPHGYHVAYGLLVQIAVERGGGEMLADLRAFCEAVGLPSTLAAMGMDAAEDADLDAIADLTMTAPHIANLARPVSRDDLRRALDVVEGRRRGV